MTSFPSQKPTASISPRSPSPGSAGSHGTLLRALGPGLLMCGAAVGVSHLVQSTRAGAEYGFLLLGLVLLACLLKYPFLEFGPRYAAATGESMLAGYRRMGRWAVGAYALITFATFWVVTATLTVVTAGLANTMFGLDWPVDLTSAGVLAACALLLAAGRFRALDLTMKIIISALAVSTLTAVVLAFTGLPEGQPFPWGPSPEILWSAAGFAFVLALLGWMPIPLDVAAWHSLWTLERARQTRSFPSVKHAVTDFQIGYIAATVLAAMFLMLGALVMYGGTGFSDSAVAFSGQLVDMYARTLGDWSRPLIAIAALTTMFSTTLAVTDAYPRVIKALIHTPPLGSAGDGGRAVFADRRKEPSRSAVARGAVRERPGGGPEKAQTAAGPPSDSPLTLRARGEDIQWRWLYPAILLTVCAGALTIIHFFSARFTLLIDFATTVSFLAAPVLAWMNLKLVTGPHMPAEHQPGPWLRILAWSGIVFLIVFCLIWVWWRLN